MGRRTDRARTPGLWIAANELPTTGGHPFYQRLNQVLDAHGFDAFVESQCAPFYADGVGRPSLTPGTYFRLLLIGYFEGIDSERGIAWRTADSLALRGFLGLGLDEVPPEHSTISRTRSRIAAGGSGRNTRRRATRSTRTGGASGVRGAGDCNATAASTWNGRTRISTRPAGCVAPTCGATPTS